MRAPGSMSRSLSRSLSFKKPLAAPAPCWMFFLVVGFDEAPKAFTKYPLFLAPAIVLFFLNTAVCVRFLVLFSAVS